jgi:hypothetical protein
MISNSTGLERSAFRPVRFRTREHVEHWPTKVTRQTKQAQRIVREHRVRCRATLTAVFFNRFVIGVVFAYGFGAY